MNADRLKIAMFTDTYLPSRDGVVTSILLTKRELEKMGHEVFIFAPEPANGVEREEGVYYCRSIGWKRYQGYRIPIFPTNKCQILDELDVDVIHTHGLLFMGLRSMFAGRTLRKPVVVSWHTMVTDAAKYYNFTPLPDEMATKLFSVYLKDLLRRAETVVVPTEAIEKELLEFSPKMRWVEVIPTGVDFSRFRPTNDGGEVRRRYGLLDKKIVLTVGRIAWEKNLELILEGFKSLRAQEPRAALMIVGEGPAKEYYQNRAKELGIAEATVFTGFVPDEDLPSYYAACDAFTLASKFETQGLVILEAMATGKAVAGIKYRAVAEIINDGVNGYLFEENSDDWIKAVRSALNAPEAVRRNARQRASQYSAADAARTLVEVYLFAIQSKRARVSGKIF
jgi:1,2-diacylglycerol 3-alpha-glucosyltransferase